MIEPTEKKNPSRALKATAAVASGIFWSLLAAWLCLVAAWCAIHGWIVPRIGDFRPRIEAEATRLLGAPVRIGSLTARSGWLVPTFALADVTVQDTQGRTALHLPLVVAALSPRSLLHLGFEQLVVEGADVDVRRAADGRLFVAGQWIKPSTGEGSRGADWLFAQSEVVLRNATVRWTDERAGSPPIALTQIDVLLRNSPWHHAMRLAATPPAGHGDRVSLVGDFSQPLLSLRPGNWRDWSGPLYADLPRVDLAQLYTQLGQVLPQPVLAAEGAPGAVPGLDHAAGIGSLRAWADLAAGGIAGATMDVDLQGLDLRFAAAPEPLQLSRLSARVTGHRSAEGFDVATQKLAFSRADGYDWPGGNVSLRRQRPAAGGPARTELSADKIDLGALAGIARGLPLPNALQRTLAERAPRGLLQSVSAHWEGEDSDPAKAYQAHGRVTGLAFTSQQPDSSRLAAAAAVEAAMRATDPHGHRHVHPPLGRPGLQGADVDFDVSEAGGKASLSMSGGTLDFPGVFDETTVPMDSLHADFSWKRGPEGQLAVQIPHVAFANADAAGEFEASWHTADEGDPVMRLPGVLDLTGSLSRADGARVYRYLPRSIAPEVRAYVQEAVSAGSASSAQFRVRGDLHHMPFDDPKLGQFRIAAKLHDVTYAYAPPEIERAGMLPWPALVKLDGELVFEGRSMEIRNAMGRLESAESMRATGARGTETPAPRNAKTPPLLAGDVQVLRADARIPDLSHAVVSVDARARGPLAEMLGIVDASPLSSLTNHVLAQASATGPADLQLGLSLPLAQLKTSKVKGAVILAGNDLRITPQSQLLGQARGTVAFTETGFTLVGTQAQMLGGDVKVEGSLKPVPGVLTAAGTPAHSLSIRAQGTLTAEGLRAATELGAAARLAASARGATSYTLAVDTTDNHPEVTVESSLQGLEIDLPAPLGKTAGSSLPLSFQTRLLPNDGKAARRDQLTLTLGDVVAVRYLRQLDGEAARVLSGALSVGTDASEHAELPDEGVTADVRLDTLDVDGWRSVLKQVGEEAGAQPPGPDGAFHPAATAPTQRSDAADYLPDSVTLRAEELTASGRTLHKLVLAGSHKDGFWRANIDARELGGYLEYRQAAGATPARLYARLAHLQVPDTAARDVESLTDENEHHAAPETSGTAGALPALDIVIDDFQLKQRHLGRLEVQAVNRDAEWRLDKLQLMTPEASFAATGRWGRRGANGPRRTELDFKLELRDTGALLGRLGMPGVVARGAGELKGKVDWPGSPFSPDYAAMDGSLSLNVSSGQFLKADPGLAKLLGVLSLQALPRRFTLDFRDVFSQGFAFDSVRGDVAIKDGIAHTDKLEMKGVAATVHMDGSADIGHETQDLRVVVVPQINAGGASLLATIVNPVVGLSTFVAQAVLSGPLNRAATEEFDITGRWVDPKIVRLRGSARSQPPAQ